MTDNTATEPRYPDVEVQLSTEDGNAFFIIARISRALRDAGVHADVINDFRNEATSGDYDHLLRTAQAWVTVL